MINQITISERAQLSTKLKKAYETAIDNIDDGASYLSYVKNNLTLTKEQTETQHSFHLFGINSYLESYFTDILLANFISFPGKLDIKSLTLEALGKYGSALGLVRHVAERAVYDVAYKSFRDVVKITLDKYSVTSKIDEALIDTVNEIKCTRDIYSHNRGIINETYDRKAGTTARKSSHDGRLPLSDAYVNQSTDAIRELITVLHDGINLSYGKYDAANAFKEMWESTSLGRNWKFDKAWEIDIDVFSKQKKRLVRPKEESFGWSSSEQALYDFFRSIFSGDKVDFRYLLSRWPPETTEGQILLSWLDSPFYF